VLGVVGVIEDADAVVRRTFRRSGDVVILLGESRGELGGSEYLKVVHGLIRGVPPALDLDRERALQKLLVDGAAAGLIRSAHDCAEGGLAVTVAECCFDTGLGVEIGTPGTNADEMWRDVMTLFGESASRAVVSVEPQYAPEFLHRAADAGVPAMDIGRVGGDRIRMSVDGRVVVDDTLHEIERLWSTAIGSYFERSRAVA
jgi:phosphoribosylformylglycinamidine synthase